MPQTLRPSSLIYPKKCQRHTPNDSPRPHPRAPRDPHRARCPLWGKKTFAASTQGPRKSDLTGEDAWRTWFGWLSECWSRWSRSDIRVVLMRILKSKTHIASYSMNGTVGGFNRMNHHWSKICLKHTLKPHQTTPPHGLTHL